MQFWYMGILLLFMLGFIAFPERSRTAIISLVEQGRGALCSVILFNSHSGFAPEHVVWHMIYNPLQCMTRCDYDWREYLAFAISFLKLHGHLRASVSRPESGSKEDTACSAPSNPPSIPPGLLAEIRRRQRCSLLGLLQSSFPAQ